MKKEISPKPENENPRTGQFKFTITWLVFLLVLLSFGLPAVRGQSAPDGFDPNANNQVFSIAVQADGKILIIGGFTGLSPNGVAGVVRNRIARLNADGTLDATFDPNANNDVDSIAVQADGKILIGGLFTRLSPKGGAAVTRNNIARLNADGTVDATFNPNANQFVGSIAVQADGKIVMGGGFTSLSPNGGAAVVRNYIARLNAAPVAIRPLLNIQRTANTNVVLSWATNFTSFTLESNTDLNANVWSVISPAPIVSGTSYVVTNAITGPARFYRLRQ